MPSRPPVFQPAHVTDGPRKDSKASDAKRGTSRERGYSSRWNKASKTYLVRNPTCVYCGQPATLVDHKKRHFGDQALFWDTSNWQSMCVTCHSSRKQSEESLSIEARRRAFPFSVGRSRIPVTIICGPAGAGKSTFVAQHAWENDLIIDLDVIRAELAGKAIHQEAHEYTEAALEERNRLLRSLASDYAHARAWFIVAAPEQDVRDAWASKLGAIEVVLLDTPLAECLRRIRADQRRAGQMDRMEDMARDWWRRFQRDRAQGGGV